jgi:hypothetical protein
LFKDSEQSVTNSEYGEAARLKIPIFAMVEHSVLNDYNLYRANRRNSAVDAAKINYPAADSTKIFEFINQVQNSSVNNALVPFRDFADIEAYLRQQWAGMMFSFLLKRNEEGRLGDTLSMLSVMSERVEMLSRQILQSVGTESAKLTAALYDKVLEYECVRDMAYMGVKPTPAAILANKTFDGCFAALGGKLAVRKDWEGFAVGGGGSVSSLTLERDRKQYSELRSELEALIKQHGNTVESYRKGAHRKDRRK